MPKFEIIIYERNSQFFYILFLIFSTHYTLQASFSRSNDIAIDRGVGTGEARASPEIRVFTT